MISVITIYTKHLCGYCDMAKAHLNKHNIAFEEVNIDDDKDAREYMRSQGHRTAPQIYHNGKLLVEGGASGLVSLSGTEIKERLGDLDFSDISL